jgi:hypothetical protein
MIRLAVILFATLGALVFMVCFIPTLNHIAFWKLSWAHCIALGVGFCAYKITK